MNRNDQGNDTRDLRETQTGRFFPTREQIFDAMTKLRIRQFLIPPQNGESYEGQGLHSVLRTLEHSEVLKEVLGNESIFSRLERELGTLSMEEDYIVKSMIMTKYYRGKGTLARPDQIPITLEKLVFEFVRAGLSTTFDVEDSRHSNSEGFDGFISALNDPVELRKFGNVGEYDKETMYIACSYRHASQKKDKFTGVGLAELWKVVMCVVRQAKYKKFAVWTDRMLSARTKKENFEWYKVGLVPYLSMRTVYICNLGNTEKDVIIDQGRMWLNIERSAAARGKGMVSYGRRMVTDRLEKHGFVFGGYHPLDPCDVWGISDGDWENWEQRLESLFLEILTTSMLHRDTHFKEDVEQLRKLAAKNLNDPRKVVKQIPVQPMLSRDSPIWHEGPWRGEDEWCFWRKSSNQQTSSSLSDALKVLEAGRAALFVEYVENGFSGGSVRKCMVVLMGVRGHTSPALAIDCTDHPIVGRRAIVTMPNSHAMIHNLILDKWGRNRDKYRFKIITLHGILHYSGLVEVLDEITLVRMLQEDDKLLTQKVLNADQSHR